MRPWRSSWRQRTCFPSKCTAKLDWCVHGCADIRDAVRVADQERAGSGCGGRVSTLQALDQGGLLIERKTPPWLDRRPMHVIIHVTEKNAQLFFFLLLHTLEAVINSVSGARPTSAASKHCWAGAGTHAQSIKAMATSQRGGSEKARPPQQQPGADTAAETAVSTGETDIASAPASSISTACLFKI
jgi:hypothetical protein